MDVIARMTAVVGGAVALVRRMGLPAQQAVGAEPLIPQARKQGIMTLKMPVAHGWRDGRLPTCAPGLKVNAFASGLDHPRWIEVLPNGDVLVAESTEEPGPPRTLMDHAAQATMRRVKAIGKSANRVSLWRDADGDGVAEIRTDFV
ncbi:MAG: sorbosone dehydrogenase family protein, partial [Rhodobacteraceae bacterium]|nr:sorbosone dehydrogenase family protein [Paracoccaceae bacterium]